MFHYRVSAILKKISEWPMMKVDWSCFDKWAQRAANLTQPCLLILGVVVYVYTVLPVYQKDALEKQIAVLGKQKEDVQKDFNATRWEFSIMSLRYSYLTSQSLRTSQIFNVDKDASEFFSVEDDKKNWPKPFDDILSALDLLSKDNEKTEKIPVSYLAKMRDIVAANKTVLQCQMPDFMALHTEFLRKLKEIETNAPIEAEKKASSVFAISSVVFSEEKKVEYRSKLTTLFAASEKTALSAQYDAKLNDMRKPCEDKADNFFDNLKHQQ